MPIALDQGGSAAPGLKLKDQGDHAIVRLCHQLTRDKREFGTNKILYKEDGKTPRKELVLTGIYMGGSAVITTGPKGKRVDEDPTLGSEVRLYIGGHKFGAWIDAKKLYKPNVGDVVKVTYTKDEPSAGGGQDKKVWKFEIRAALSDVEGADVQKAEAIFHRIAQDGISESEEQTDDQSIPF